MDSGYHPMIAYDEISKDIKAKMYVDFLVRGEGELTFNELVYALSGKKDIKEVKGPSYKINGESRHNEPRNPCDLSKLRLPDRSSRTIRSGFHIFGITSFISFIPT